MVAETEEGELRTACRRVAAWAHGWPEVLRSHSHQRQRKGKLRRPRELEMRSVTAQPLLRCCGHTRHCVEHQGSTEEQTPHNKTPPPGKETERIPAAPPSSHV